MSESTKWRKKPVVIEAIQMPRPWSTDTASDAERAEVVRQGARVYAWLMNALGAPAVNTWWVADDGAHIATLEGVMVASPRDWLIRGVQGEVYPCKPDIFEATYEAVTE